MGRLGSELRSLTAWGVKLLRDVAIWHRTLLGVYLLVLFGMIYANYVTSITYVVKLNIVIST